jgi:subtilisin family serine protease
VRGRTVDWAAIAPRLEIKHDRRYKPPEDDHGTHVAGILAADWRSDDEPSPGEHHVRGMCPDIEIYDLRAFGAEGSDEFQILSAMQFVRHLNAHADKPLIHGVNLSFSLRHEVEKYAAGATPVCEEAHRLVGSGVVVVAAAGNEGRGGYVVKGRSVEGYRPISITDPGNAEKVITVGATHGDKPHTYGVSYFSSRGPTGDGRAKPDLVAPGERIFSPVPEAGIQSKDGTSQAAPHVSGACALLMARHPELMGQPERVKEIIVDTCTDLGRDRSFQGAGLVDVLRAIQAV